MGYKKDESEQLLDQLEVPISLEKFIDELPDRYENSHIDREIEEQVDQEWNTFQFNMKKKNRSVIRKRTAILSLSVAAAFGLFVGTAFVSPAVAQMASNIPYLNLIFENKIEAVPIGEEINKALFDQNFQNISAHVDYKTKYIEVMIFEPKEYYNEVKAPIEDLIRGILKERNEKEYSFNVLNDPETGQMWKEMAENDTETDRKMDKVEEIVYQVLDKYGYNSPRHTSGLSLERINLELPETETRIQEIIQEMKVSLKQLGDFEVKVYTYDPQLIDREVRFMPLFDTIAKGLKAESDFKVFSVGYTNNKYRDHFHIVIRTTVKSSNSDIEEVVANIEKTVQDFLQSEDALKAIQNDKYQVLIFSEDDKKMKVIKN